MGGIGSTRWREHRRRPLVEDAPPLDFLDPKWRDVLSLDRASGTLEWCRGAEVVPARWADFHLNPVQSDGTRLLVLDFTREPTEPKERVILEQVRVGFSQRWYARCPGGCDCLARKLFLTEKSTLVCWRCAGLQYRSAQGHDKRLDRCRKNPRLFFEQRSHLQSPRSRLVTSWIYFQAESQGFRIRDI